jgi:alanyl-tRNA synthetase
LPKAPEIIAPCLLKYVVTTKLYRQNAYMKDFQSTVLEVQQNAVRLEATAFYPTAGGQAFDTGTLNKIAVLETREHNGAIWHTINGSLEVGQQVTGQLDWARRFDHMQQHTGEHLLGQAFFRLERFVIAVNMEHSVCTLDLDAQTSWDMAMQAEEAVNHAIWSNLPIQSYEVPDTNIHTVPLRRTPKVSGQIRVVQIGDYDYSACGGTHTQTSSEVGMLKILKLERVKSGATRVYFNCGGRLLSDYRFKHDFVANLGLQFSTALENVPTRTQAVLDELSAAKRQLALQKTQLAQYLAASFHSGVVLHELADASMLPELAKICTLRPNLLALLGAKDGDKALLAVACGQGVQHHAAELLKIGLAHIGGKGGGKPELAQGSGDKPEALGMALEAMQAALESSA